jgi:hypothetical protein
MFRSLASVEDITPIWLTACLRESGHLPQGYVTKITKQEPLKAWSGTLTPIIITYQDNSPAPERLIFKQWHSAWAHAAAHELYFYATIAPQMPELRVPHLYYEHHTSTSAYVLYEDFSVHHRVPQLDHAPPLDKVKQIVDMMAVLHARWWDNPQLQHEQLTHLQSGPLCMSHLPTADVLQEYNRLIKYHARQLITAFSDNLADSWRSAFEWAVEHWYDFAAKRVAKNQHLTLIHGDIHWHNLAFHTSNSEILVFDWETYKRGLGTFDVAYFLHDTYWREARQQHEKPLLQQYHNTLIQLGVRNYSWDDLVTDYRLSLVVLLFVHMQWRGLGFDHATAFIQDAVDGFELWECRSKLGAANVNS